MQGTTAAVTAGHPLAAAEGARVLREGGNAVDAAITMAAVLAVVRPHMNGVGGDAFLLIRDAATGEVHALNGSGRAGSLATPARFAELGLDEIPGDGLLSVSVPGAVRAWEDALARFGTISLADALAPAIHYAEEGFPVSRILAEDIASSARTLAADPALAAVFLPAGEPPRVGSILRQPELAVTLRAIAERGSAGFYRGDVADAIVGLMEREDGLLTARDLATHESSWHQPLDIEHRGFRVLAFPPNTQGLALLMQLNMAEHFDLEAMGHNTVEYVHTMVELKKLAFADRDRHVADPFFVDVPVERLISESYAADLADGV
ncbi:MAG: gamma-glutamyltransferase family protein, partial [Longimicrobiales bacterium]